MMDVHTNLSILISTLTAIHREFSKSNNTLNLHIVLYAGVASGVKSYSNYS
jgi:hypothetical protein